MNNLEKAIAKEMKKIYDKYPTLNSFSFNLYDGWICDEAISLNEKSWEEYGEEYWDACLTINECLEKLEKIEIKGCDYPIPPTCISLLKESTENIKKHARKCDSLMPLIDEWNKLGEPIYKKIKPKIGPLFKYSKAHYCAVLTKRDGSVKIYPDGKDID